MINLEYRGFFFEFSISSPKSADNRSMKRTELIWTNAAVGAPLMRSIEAATQVGDYKAVFWAKGNQMVALAWFDSCPTKAEIDAVKKTLNVKTSAILNVAIKRPELANGWMWGKA